MARWVLSLKKPLLDSQLAAIWKAISSIFIDFISFPIILYDFMDFRGPGFETSCGVCHRNGAPNFCSIPSWLLFQWFHGFHGFHQFRGFSWEFMVAGCSQSKDDTRLLNDSRLLVFCRGVMAIAGLLLPGVADTGGFCWVFVHDRWFLMSFTR